MKDANGDRLSTLICADDGEPDEDHILACLGHAADRAWRFLGGA